MTQVVHAYTWCADRSAEAKHAGQPDEHGTDAGAIGRPSPNPDEEIVALSTKLGPYRQIRFQRPPGRRLKREKALLIELFFADDQAIVDQIVTLESERL